MSSPDISDEERAVLRAAQLADLMSQQTGVVTRAQLIHGGLTSEEIRRRTRRRELVRVHPRVYVTHTGPLTGSQRAWAAVLYAGRGAALCGPSLDQSTRDGDQPIHVAIDQRRRVTPTAGIVLHRVSRLDTQVFPGSEPRRLRLEDNALLMADRADSELDVVAILAGVVGRRGVTATSLRTALARHPRLRRRRFITLLIDDLAAGTASVLEQAYLERVERAHGLPRATANWLDGPPTGCSTAMPSTRTSGSRSSSTGDSGTTPGTASAAMPTATWTISRCTAR